MERKMVVCKVKEGSRKPWRWIKCAEIRGNEIVILTSDSPCSVDSELCFAAAAIFRNAKSKSYHREIICSFIQSFSSSKEADDNA